MCPGVCIPWVLPGNEVVWVCEDGCIQRMVGEVQSMTASEIWLAIVASVMTINVTALVIAMIIKMFRGDL